MQKSTDSLKACFENVDIKLYLHNDSLITLSIPIDLKHCVIKGLYCILEAHLYMYKTDSDIWDSFGIEKSCCNPFFIAHQIRISEILPWDRKSYLTHAILPRLSLTHIVVK